MSDKQSPINGFIFVLFWLVLLGLLSYLFYRWHQINLGGIVQTEVSQTQKTLLIRMDSANTYRADGKINGLKVNFIVDTGANSVAIPNALAQKANLKPLRRITVHTASGKSTGYLTRIKLLTIGPISLHNIRGTIMPDESKYVLLGMSALKKLELRQRDDYLMLRQLNR